MTDQSPTNPLPVRVQSLDVVRGLAVLGILAVNAISFAAPIWYDPAFPAGHIPVEAGDGFARWITSVFFSQKFVSLFSMLFGISVYLVGSERGSEGPTRLLKRRLFWLGIIGAIHGILFWFGDILLSYAIAGALFMGMRSWSAKKLLKFGLIGSAAFAALSGFVYALTSGAAEQDTASTFMDVGRSIAAYHSGWPAGLWENLKAWLIAFPTGLFIYTPAMLFLMMTGLGLFKSGFFHGRWPHKTYLALIAAGAVSLVILGTLGWPNAQGLPQYEAVFLGFSSFAFIISLAYASLMVLIGARQLWLRRLLAPVGQMAFTNYLTQTLIMASLFYLPWGPHLMGHVGQTSLWGIVIAVWALQLIWSPLWLKHFRMGPLEWIWRCFTHGQRLPLRRV